MRLVFAGSPEIALPSLKMIVEAGIDVGAVVSQPDRPAGRGQQKTAPPIAIFAKAQGIPLLQPEELNDAFSKSLSELSPDFLVVVAYGQILPKSLLSLPKNGSVNLHFSLLPQYRGAAPVQWALIHGETETGVTTLKMTERLDAGPILLQRNLPIEPEDTVVILSRRLANAGGELLLETLKKWDEITPQTQDETNVSWAPSLKKENGLIDWSRSAKSLANLIRGTNPWPGAYTFLDRKRLKIYSADAFPRQTKSRSGEVIAAGLASLDVACGQGFLQLKEVQLEGAKRLSVSEFLKGHPISPGTKLG